MTTREPSSTNEYLVEAESLIAECQETGSRKLTLVHLRLRRLPESIRDLTWLRRLYVDQNKLTELPDWIDELVELEVLWIAYNPLKTLPSSLRRLRKLREINISGSKLSAVSDVIGSLTGLRKLVVGDLGLRVLPDWIRGLQKLDSLYLYGNRWIKLPDWIVELSQLERLGLNDNQLNALPTSLRHLRKLRYVNIDGNPLLNLPTEISGSRDAKKILDYYFRINFREAPPLNEFKLILVGRGGVGKTTLVHRLVTDKYKEFKRTPGIKITKWPVEIDGDDVRAHVWDFGGQEIMHGTHRFFMTERALYLVFISGREGTEDRDAEYWLSLVRSFAGDVPVIVLLNKWDDYSFELNRELLREKYGNLTFVETDSKTDTGIPELRKKICQLARKLPGLKAAWPGEWRRIKDELPAKKKSWLTFEDFREFCNELGITKAKDQEALAESLHDLGLMLSFRKEEALRDFGVLNPVWITKGIYEVLNSRALKEAQGKFTAATFADVLPRTSYPEKLHPYLLALMRKFRLCFPLDDKGEKYLVPELLTKEEPNLETEFPPEKCLGFVYRYDAVLPEGLLPRFIVETYVHREPKRAWRSGVVLERANCRALVRGDVQGRMVTIRVAGVGQGHRELLGIIREHFERIHKSFEKLPVTELVPIPEHPEVLVPYNDLLDYEAAGDDEYKVVINRQPVKQSVAALLDGVDLPGVRRPADRLVPFHRDFVADRDSLSLFISYSHKDDRLRDELRGALTAYERKGEIKSWDDTDIVPGQTWEPEILGKLERADIVVLLLSNDFIRSDYCYVKEMTRARERDAAGECAIVPIVVRACAYTKLELGQLQAILPDGKPVKQNRDRDAAWSEVTKQLDRAIANLKKKRLSS
ncbi:MAG: TIR domain-containing protein [Pyrinomonadaceae bacterium]|nr:TIR domain-containing protein [Pyrinomonadaceae bacterium]